MSAGPQEERQRTEADVIHEVERELQQLGTGEAFCALLQADGSLRAARTRLHQPDHDTPGDPGLIDQIRRRSQQLLSRPWQQVHEEITRRQTVAQDVQAPPPRTDQPEPDTGSPIGRR